MLTILIANWRVTVIALLAALLTIATTMCVHYRDRLLLCESRAENAVAISEQAQAKFNKTVSIMEAEHDKLVAEAKEIAVSNYCKRYGCGKRPAPTVSPVAGRVRVELPTATADFADRAEAFDGRPADAVVDNTEFVLQCAETTVLYNEWRTFATLNQLPIKE